jgi:glycosyltransferase domain-containing protein
MSLLSKLSIVIPTYNRQSYALRNMCYWSGSEVTVHVLDGSAEAIKPSQIDSLAPNIHYHHLPVSIWMRLEKVNDLVTTQYVSLLADDEFFIPSAIEASILELENDQELVACCGKGISKSLSGDLTVHFSTAENDKYSYRKGGNGFTQDDPVARMIFHMNPYNSGTIYAVCQSQAWLPTMGMLCAREFSTTVVGELMFELSISFQGKTKIINELMQLRSAENPPNEDGCKLQFHTWYAAPTYAREVDDFLNITATGLAAVCKGDSQAIRIGLEQACSAYIAFCDNHFQNNQPLRSYPKVMRLLSAAIPQAQKSFTKKAISKLPISFLRALPRRIRYRPYIDIAKGLESEGLHVDWDQLSSILETVRKFHAYNP